MPRLAPIVALAAVALALPATADAKEMTKLAVCGPSHCASSSDPALLREWMEASGGGPTGPAAIAPFYRLEFTIKGGHGETFDNGKDSATWSIYYVPAARVLSGPGESGGARWSRIGPRAAQLLRKVGAGIAPFAAPVVDGATVGGRRAAGPATYARLFDRKWETTYRWPETTKRIVLHSHPVSPWTDGKNELLFSSKQKLLVRDGETVKVPNAVAKQLGRARSLTARSGGGSGLAIGFAGMAAVAIGGIAWWDHRRRRS